MRLLYTYTTQVVVSILRLRVVDASDTSHLVRIDAHQEAAVGNACLCLEGSTPKTPFWRK